MQPKWAPKYPKIPPGEENTMPKRSKKNNIKRLNYFDEIEGQKM